jgi:hypothetical protein
MKRWLQQNETPQQGERNTDSVDSSTRMQTTTTTTTTTPKLAFPTPVRCHLHPTHRALWKCLFKKFATMSNQAEVYREDLPAADWPIQGRVTKSTSTRRGIRFR